MPKLLEWGFLEDLLKSLFSLSNDLDLRPHVLKAISNILSFKKERIYIVNKMSEFEFERLLDDIMDEPDEERSETIFFKKF